MRPIGLQTRLTLAIAVAASLLVALLGWYWSERAERDQTEALRQREVRMAALASRGFAGPLWNLDQPAVTTLLDAVMADPEVQSIQLHAPGLEGDSLKRERAEPADDPLPLKFDIVNWSMNGGTDGKIGSGELVYTRAYVHAAVEQTRRLIATLLLAMLVAVVAVSAWLINRWVKMPVSRLGAVAERVAAGELGATMPIERRDEIGALTERFNTMSHQLKLSSEVLLDSEARYRSLFENAPIGIFQTDSRGRLLELNKVLAHMLGFARPEAALEQASTLGRLASVDPIERKRVARALLRHHRLVQLPLLITTHDGRQGWVELSAHQMQTPTGMRIEGMVSDITQRRAAEQELARRRADLEELVTERTAELSDAKVRAEAASQSKSRFLATMSHEFRTPLNAILGFSQLLQMDAALTPTQTHRVSLIRDSGEHLLSLIKDVLDMASIEAGRVKLTPEVIDLRALLEVAADSVRLRAEEKHLQFLVSLHAELPSKVRTDGQRLRQVLLNLLSNAMRFTDTGHVSLVAEPVARGVGSVRVRFAVTDSGVGIDAQQRKRLFQPFEQVGEDARRHGGTGLGLSISQQLVKLMGGEIVVESEKGMGSCFSFELDLTEA